MDKVSGSASPFHAISSDGPASPTSATAPPGGSTHKELQDQLGKAPTLSSTGADQRRGAKLPLRVDVAATTASTPNATSTAAATTPVLYTVGESPFGSPTTSHATRKSGDDPIGAVCKEFSTLGLANPMRSAKKTPKSAEPMGLLGLVHSNIYSEYQRAIHSPGEAAPEDKAKREDKNRAMNGAIRTIDDINHQLVTMLGSVEAQAKALETATRKEALMLFMKGKLEVSRPRGPSHAIRQEIDDALKPLKDLAESLAGQLKRLPLFPEMPQKKADGTLDDQRPSKRQEIKDKLMRGTALVHRLHTASLNATTSDSVIDQAAMLKTILTQERETGGVTDSTRQAVQQFEQHLDQDGLWRDVLRLAEALKVNDDLPHGMAEKMTPAMRRSDLLEASIALVTTGCAAQFSLLDSSARYRVLDLSDWIDMSVTSAMRKQVNEAIRAQEEQRRALATPDTSGAGVFIAEMTQLKRMADAQINRISGAMRMNVQDGSQKSISPKERQDIEHATEKLARIDIAYGELAKSARHTLEIGDAATADKQLEPVIAGLEFGRLIAQSMVTIGRACVEPYPRPAAPLAKPVQPAAEPSAPAGDAVTAPQETVQSAGGKKAKDKGPAPLAQASDTTSTARQTGSKTVPTTGVDDTDTTKPTQTARPRTGVAERGRSSGHSVSTSASAGAENVRGSQGTRRVQEARDVGEAQSTKVSTQTIQEIKADVMPKQALAKDLMTAGKNELWNHSMVLFRFQAYELAADEALSTAIDCFRRAAKLRGEVSRQLDGAPPHYRRALEVDCKTAHADLDEARNELQKTIRFRNSPLSKRPDEAVMQQMEAQGLAQLNRPQFFEPDLIKVRIDRQDADPIWLHMHLRRGTQFRRPEDLKASDFVSGPTQAQRNAISVKNNYYDSLESNRDRYGNDTPRVPWNRRFAFGVFQRALNAEPAPPRQATRH